MANKTLRALIQASGHTPVAGMSFRNHVNGAGTGVSMSSYNLYGWNGWNLSNVPGASVPSGYTFNLTFNFDHGGNFGAIMPGAEDMGATATSDAQKTEGSPINPTIVAASLTSQPSGGGQCSLTIAVEGYAVPVTSVAYLRSGFADEPWGWIPPDPGPHDIAVELQAHPLPSEVVGQSDTGYIWITYPPDVGNFNDGLEYGPIPITVQRSVGQSSNFEIEWYDSPDYGNPEHLVQSGGFSYRFTSAVWENPGQGEFYVRWRNGPGQNWNTIIAPWDDPRFN